ncbi:hypothetical protein C5167_011676, partial [Papaver somniferum]
KPEEKGGHTLKQQIQEFKFKIPIPLHTPSLSLSDTRTLEKEQLIGIYSNTTEHKLREISKVTYRRSTQKNDSQNKHGRDIL